jgi:phage terminase small subunit
MLTQKKRLYAQGRLLGKCQTDAAIFAGCPAATAAQAASRYEKDPDVIAHLARLKQGEPEPQAVKSKREPRPKVEKPPKEVAPPPAPTVAQGDDPVEFMKAMWQNEEEDPKLRLEAAKAHASFTRAKPGEKGKKEQKQEAAERAGSGRFGLRAVK